MSEILNISGSLPNTDRNISPGYSELSVLIKDCIAQKRSAQKKLYDTYSPVAYGIIKRYLYSNDGMAQEVLNDSFYKIFIKLEQYSFQGAVEGWIRRIVINTITDHLRKNIKNDKTHKEVEHDDAYINSDSVEKLNHKELLKIIETIPETQRLVFNLFVFENYTHKGISKLLNINENNCRWHLNDARRRLKEKINSIMK